MTGLRAFSFGGGVQSTAVLVLAAQGRVDFRTFLFANTGDDSENPDTLAYLRDVARPYAEAHGLEIHELRYVSRAGASPTLYQEMTRPDRGMGLIPVWFTGAGPGIRSCTRTWKIRVIARWLREHGASREAPAVEGLGISLDEIRRMRSDSGFPYYTLEYPLIDLRIRRGDCVSLIEAAGLPVPPKSSCWFCPFHTPREWQAIKHEKPALFAKAVALESTLNEARAARGRDRVSLHTARRPLAQAVGDSRQLDLFDTCESGFCMT